jgi:hypothetical protein
VLLPVEVVIGAVLTAGELAMSTIRCAERAVSSLAGLTRFLVQAADLEDVMVRVSLNATPPRMDVTAFVHGLDAESRAARAHVDTVAAHVDLNGRAGTANVDMAVLGLHAIRLDGQEMGASRSADISRATQWPLHRR